jgi:hypothetical protein
MTENEARTYIAELFRIVGTSSILVMDTTGKLHRLNCPFQVFALEDIPPWIREGNHYLVEAVRMSIEIQDIFVINGRGYFFWGFLILLG